MRRAFAGVDLADLDPFVHMDQMGEVEYGPGEPKGTPWHPHRGFETVTYMIDGTFQHQDSIGGGGLIANGATQWMTAGAGILHIERPPDALVASGGLFHGIQLWVNLPAADKWVPPALPGHRGRPVDAAVLARRRRARAGDRRRGRRPRRPGRHLHADRPGRTPPSAPGAGCRCPGARVQRPGLRPGRAGHRSDAEPGRSRRASWPCTVPATPSRSAPTRPRNRAHPTSTCSCSAAGPSASRSAVYGPFVMNTRDETGPGLRGLPRRQAGHRPGRPHRGLSHLGLRRRPVGDPTTLGT